MTKHGGGSVSAHAHWSSIHAAAAALDAARGRIGYDGVFDAFGGSYHPSHYEARGLAGVVAILDALRRITEHAWETVHAAARDHAAALVLRDEDGSQWVSVDRVGAIRYHRTRRGARARATRIGGIAKLQPDLVRQIAAANRRAEAVLSRVRAAVAALLAARPLAEQLCVVGVLDADQDSSITWGVGRRGQVHCTGLRWLAGESSEGRSVTEDEARAFVDGGLPALRDALAA